MVARGRARDNYAGAWTPSLPLRAFLRSRISRRRDRARWRLIRAVLAVLPSLIPGRRHGRPVDRRVYTGVDAGMDPMVAVAGARDPVST